LIVLVFDGGMGFTLDAKASFEPTCPDVVWPTDAKDREMMDDLMAGRDAAKSRDEEHRKAAIVRIHFTIRCD